MTELEELSRKRATKQDDDDFHAHRIARRFIREVVLDEAKKNHAQTGDPTLLQRVYASRIALWREGQEVYVIGWTPHGAQAPYQNWIYLIAVLSLVSGRDLFGDFDV